MLLQGLRPQFDLVGLEVEGAGAGAHGVEPLLGGMAVLTQPLEFLAARPHCVHLILVVVTERLEHGVQPAVFVLDDRLETRQGGALGLQALPSCRGGRPLLGVTRQPPLDLRLTFGQHASALGDAGDAHLERLATTGDFGSACHHRFPCLQGLLQLWNRPGQARLLRSDLGEPLFRCGDAGACVVELLRQATLFFDRTGSFRLAGLGGDRMAVGGPFGGDAGVPGAAEDDPRLAQRGASQLRSGGGLFGPASGLVDRGGRDHPRRRTHSPARGGEAVALGGDDDQVVAGEGEVNRLFPAVHAHGAADQGVEDRFRHGAPAAGAHVAAHRFGTAARRQRRHRIRRGAGRFSGCQHSSGHPTVAEGGQSGLRRAPTVDDDRSDARAGRRLEGGVPTVVDLDEVDQGTHDAIDFAQQFAPPAPCRSDSARSSASARAAVR